MRVVKIFIVCLIFKNFLFSESISEQQSFQSENKNIIIKKVWESNYHDFLIISMSLNDKNILSYQKDGNIKLYIYKNLININLTDIFQYIKFDIIVDKDKLYQCELNKENHKNCSLDYYTTSAADEIGNGLFSFGKSLFQGKLMIEKKFDSYVFAKIILKNEDFLKQFLERLINKNLYLNAKHQIENKNDNTLNTGKVKRIESW